MKKDLNITAIIPAAGRPTNTILNNSTLPDTMIPINGKPVIGYIIEDLIHRGINKVIVVLNKSDTHTEQYVSRKFSERISLKIVRATGIPNTLNDSIKTGLSEVSGTDSILVYLGDTIYKGKLKFDKDFLVVSKKYEDSSKWCIVEKTPSGKLAYINKPSNYSGKGDVLCGIYFFTKPKKIISAMEESVLMNSSDISDVIERYSTDTEFDLINATGWYDCGNIDNYHSARIDFLKVRSFNALSYNSLYGYITKSGSNPKKIIQEIDWFLNIPDELRIFSPRLISYSLSKTKPSYSIEFYGYQSLADMFTFGSLNTKTWEVIIEHIFEVLKVFKKHSKKIPYSSYHDTYYTKTIERINELRRDKWWKTILSQDVIYINGNGYKNITPFLEKLPKLVEGLYSGEVANIIHGDLCLSNILFDPGSKLLKFIDPRGKFGKESVYGDGKYDIAKLQHSFLGNYDFIVADLFNLSSEKNNFKFDIYTEPAHDQIKLIFETAAKRAGYNKKDIRLIEALLFISMIPLHSDNRNRQIMMFLRGVELIQEFI